MSSIYRGAEQAREKKTGDGGVVESPNQQGRVFTSERIFCTKAPIFVVYCKFSAMPTIMHNNKNVWLIFGKNILMHPTAHCWFSVSLSLEKSRERLLLF